MVAVTNGRVSAHAVVIDELEARFAGACHAQTCADGIPTVWVERDQLVALMQYLRRGIAKPYVMLFDLSAIDERLRTKREGQPASDFTVFYHLMSLERNEDLRVKVALAQSDCSLPSVVGVYPVANWYEREAFDMFGIHFAGHPNLRRILTPPHWEGHPLRKEHPARATEMDPFKMTNEFQDGAAGGPALRARRVGHVAQRETHRLHVPEPRTEPSERPRRVPHRVATRRRGDRRCGAGDRLPPSRRRKDGRAAVVAYVHPVHRPHRLSRRRDEQPAVCDGGRAPRRHRRCRIARK